MKSWSFIQKNGIYFVIILFAVLHFFVIFFPSSSTVFDEYYYVPASKDLLNLTASNVEHPFFGKIWGALGILAFGNNFIGWRFFYILIGLASLFVFYKLCQNFMSDEYSLLATSFLGFENIFFVHTSLLLLEGPSLLFALLSFYSYFKKRYYFSAALMGLSILSKEWGVYFAISLVLYHLISRRKDMLLTKQSVIKALTFILIVSAVALLPLWLYDAAYHPFGEYVTSTGIPFHESLPLQGITVPAYGTITAGLNVSIPSTTQSFNVTKVAITNPLQNWVFYYQYQSTLTGCSATLWNCYPWNWVLPSTIQPLPYYVNTSQHISWLGVGNIVLWYSLFFVIVATIMKAIRKELRSIDIFVICWLAGTFLPLLYISLVLNRVMYSFYMFNVDPALAIGLASAVFLLKNKFLALLWLADEVSFFIIYFPVHPLSYFGINFGNMLPELFVISVVLCFLLSYSIARMIRSFSALTTSVIITLATLIFFLGFMFFEPASLSAFRSSAFIMISVLLQPAEFFISLYLIVISLFYTLRYIMHGMRKNN